MTDREPSKLTRVLVNKIHGGRKQDSKFWQSEFDQGDADYSIAIPKQEKRRRQKRLLISSTTIGLLIVGAFALVGLKPELFPFLDRKWIHKNTVQRDNHLSTPSTTDEVQERYKRVSYAPSSNSTPDRNLQSYTPKIPKHYAKKKSPPAPKPPVYSYSYKDDSGVFKTIETTEILDSRLVRGQPYYSGRTEKGDRLARFLNHNHGVTLE